MAFTIYKCPNCGEELSIPDKLENVICMYCGIRFEYKVTEKNNMIRLSFDDELKLAYNTLSDEITIPKPNEEVFTKYSYPDSFDRYCKCFEKSLSHLDNAAILCDSAKKDEIIREYGHRVIDDITACVDKAIGSADKIDARFLCARHVVSFTVPAALKHISDYSEKLADAIVARWNEKYRKHTICKSTYEEINQGFNRKYKLCYITTAVCERMGKPDNCYELTALRSFRDNYLANTPCGKQEIQEYYLFAPMILKRIKDDREYDRIWEQYLKPCINDIENGNNEKCHERYRFMVSELRQKWLIN